jgi:folK: 2-amino-4-hydroxy-6-hydroxymethyldihydropteridine pyrophosphokinase
MIFWMDVLLLTH